MPALNYIIQQNVQYLYANRINLQGKKVHLPTRHADFHISDIKISFVTGCIDRFVQRKDFQISLCLYKIESAAKSGSNSFFFRYFFHYFVNFKQIIFI